MAMAKKRSGPDPVDPVHWKSVRYEAVPWGKARGLKQNGGYVAAFDEATGAELWLVKVYDVTYERGMEHDKQDVFITSLAVDRNRGQLAVENEAGERFVIDLETRAVSPP